MYTIKKWKPLQQNYESSRVNRIIEKIAYVLEITCPRIDRPGLFNGKTGVALFYFYYSRFTKDPYYQDVGERLLRDVFKDINTGYSFHTMADGLAGIAWTLEHLATKRFISWHHVYEIRQLDKFLGKMMVKDIGEGNYDYLHGALGPANYLLKHIENNNNRAMVEELIINLDKKSMIENSYLKWLSVVDHKKGTKGINLGLSHGMASIIYFLLRALKMKVMNEEVEQMITGVIDYIIDIKEQNLCKNSCFPNWIVEDQSFEDSRLAWCYGDAGIGTVLWQAGKYLKTKELEKTALEVLYHSAARRDLTKNGIVDASLCHGSSGLSLIFNRLYQETNKKEFYDAAMYWLGVVLDQSESEDGLAGFKYWKPGEEGSWKDEYNFLEGIAGIGLTLISSVSTIGPDWDACLMIS